MNVLLIDDKPKLLESLSETLARRDYDVRTASNGRDGIDIALGRHDPDWTPNIIFCDVDLGGDKLPEWEGQNPPFEKKNPAYRFTGPKVIKYLRDQIPRESCTMILMTALSTTDGIKYAPIYRWWAGADGTMTKGEKREETFLVELGSINRRLASHAIAGTEYDVKKLTAWSMFVEILRRCMAAGKQDEHFRIKLQPKVDRQKKLLGAESLFRVVFDERHLTTWQKAPLGPEIDLQLLMDNHLVFKDPEGYRLETGKAIQLAENLGFVRQIGRWVLRETCRTGVELGLTDLKIAVNVSVQQIEKPERFIGEVLAILKETGFPAKSLELEITESKRSDEKVKAFIGECHKHGVSTALDDFGEGLTGLEQMEMDFGTVKIDQRFIRFIDNHQINRPWIKFVIEQGKLFNKTIVAEGVEDDETAEFLAKLGCDQFQGYFFSRPINPVDFRKLYEQNR